MARVLVTGGAGFVGSNLVTKLLQDGHYVQIIDDLSNGLESNVEKSTPFLKANLADDSWIKNLAGEKFDAVIHCAAQASNATSFRDPINDLQANQLSTLQVLKFCKNESIRRLIFTSSMSVYGNPEVFPTPPSVLPNPKTFYALHKATSETYLKLSDDIDWTIFRLYTTYGAGQNLSNREQGLVKIFLSYIIENSPIKVHGSGERIRDIIHVNDVVEAISLSLFNKNSYGKIYNLGTGKTLTVNQIIETLYEKMNLKGELNIEYEAPDVGDPFKTQADITSTIEDLSWNPKISPMDGINMTVSRFKNF